jgi:hypothetical protein
LFRGFWQTRNRWYREDQDWVQWWHIPESFKHTANSHKQVGADQKCLTCQKCWVLWHISAERESDHDIRRLPNWWIKKHPAICLSYQNSFFHRRGVASLIHGLLSTDSLSLQSREGGGQTLLMVDLREPTCPRHVHLHMECSWGPQWLSYN